jgi:hypothetical protein
MPFLEGPFAFTGTLDKFSAYRMRGVDKIVVRRKGGPSAEKVKTSPSFKNTRHTMSEFGGCSRHGSYVRMAMLQIRHLSDYNFGSDINSILRQVQLRDGTGDWGRRSITLSEHTRMLEGFSTMRKAPSFDSVVRTPVYYTMDRTNRSARIEIPELMRDINYFPQNNHAMFRLTVTLGIVPDVAFDVPAKEYLPPAWYDRAYYSKSISTMWNPSLEGMESTILELATDALPPDDRWTLMLSIGIEYGAFREYGEIKAVARVGAAKILALRGKDAASGNGTEGDRMKANEVRVMDEEVAKNAPVIEIEKESGGYREPEVRYVYTTKDSIVERPEVRVYSYAISVNDVACTADASEKTSVVVRPVVRIRLPFPEGCQEAAAILGTSAAPALRSALTRQQFQVADASLFRVVGGTCNASRLSKVKEGTHWMALFYQFVSRRYYFTKRTYLPSSLIITNVSVPAVPV